MQGRTITMMSVQMREFRCLGGGEYKGRVWSCHQGDSQPTYSRRSNKQD